MATTRPGSDEYAPYYHTYVGKVPDGDILGILREQATTFRAFLAAVPRDHEQFAYAPGKWTVREVAQHVADTERVMTYRALRIGRGDTLALPGFDENAWTPMSGANQRPLADIAAEFTAVRTATLALFSGFPEPAWTRRGTASEKTVTPLALAYIAAGHIIHHQGILRERYLGA